MADYECVVYNGRRQCREVPTEFHFNLGKCRAEGKSKVDCKMIAEQKALELSAELKRIVVVVYYE